MTYQEAVEKINSLLVFGSKPGLERVAELVERIGSPDKRLRFVHIAGTNGKGSTCALLANTLKYAGYKTGMFISPYVLEFRERFQINGEMIPENRLASVVEEIFPVVEAMKQEGKIITEFELVLAAALQWYAQEQCDVVVLETGLGGRFDATNIINTPLASVITSVSLDHTAILGDTYRKIAFEKCGIIKEGGVTVAYSPQQEGVTELIADIAAQRHNRFIPADTRACTVHETGLDGSHFTFVHSALDGGSIDIRIPLIGEHQIHNAATALYTIIALREQGMHISDAAVQEGFKTVFFPARLEKLRSRPIVLLDGAHNPGGAEALRKAITENLGGKKIIAVTGMLADKDVESVLRLLAPLFDRIITLTPDNPRAMTAQELSQRISRSGTPAQSEEDFYIAYQNACLMAGNDGAVVIFGSLYLASDMRRVITEHDMDKTV